MPTKRHPTIRVNVLEFIYIYEIAQASIFVIYALPLIVILEGNMATRRRADANVVLCVFPNQSDFVVVDTRKPGGDVREVAIREIFTDELWNDLVNTLNEGLKIEELLAKDILDLTENFGQSLQRLTMNKIFQMVDEEQPTEAESARSVGLMVFAGEILNLPADAVSMIVGELFGDSLNRRVTKLLIGSLKERIVLEKLSRQDSIKKVIFDSDDSSFKTIWKSDN